MAAEDYFDIDGGYEAMWITGESEEPEEPFRRRRTYRQTGIPRDLPIPKREFPFRRASPESEPLTHQEACPKRGDGLLRHRWQFTSPAWLRCYDCGAQIECDE